MIGIPRISSDLYPHFISTTNVIFKIFFPSLLSYFEQALINNEYAGHSPQKYSLLLLHKISEGKENSLLVQLRPHSVFLGLVCFLHHNTGMSSLYLTCDVNIMPQSMVELTYFSLSG